MSWTKVAPALQDSAAPIAYVISVPSMSLHPVTRNVPGQIP